MKKKMFSDKYANNIRKLPKSNALSFYCLEYFFGGWA